MSKKKIQLSGLGNQHVADHLKRFYPFLKKEYRQISKNEIGKETVFRELFGNDIPLQLHFIKAIYTFQQCDTKTKTI